MRKLITTITLVFLFGLPIMVHAQTNDETWISLGDYLKDNYKKKGKYLVPKYPNNFLYVTKLAYKVPEDNIILPKSDIIINKVNHIENHGIPVFDKDGALIINQLFKIYQNKKPASLYNVREGENGFKIIDLNGIGSLTSVYVKKASKTKKDDIFDHIYVTLDPNQDPCKIKENIIKTNEEKNKKEEKISSSPNSSSTIPFLNL